MKVSGPDIPPRGDDISESLAGSINELTGNVQTAGELLSAIAQDISRLVRLEIELAKQEITDLVKSKAVALGMGAVGVVLALFIVPFVLLTIFELLAEWLPRWASALVVTILIAAACAIIFFLAKKKLEGEFVPKRTVASLKENVRWAKRLKR